MTFDQSSSSKSSALVSVSVNNLTRVQEEVCLFDKKSMKYQRLKKTKRVPFSMEDQLKRRQVKLRGALRQLMFDQRIESELTKAESDYLDSQEIFSREILKDYMECIQDQIQCGTKEYAGNAHSLNNSS